MYIIMFGNWIFKQTKRYHFFRVLTKKGKLTPFVQVRKRILYKNRVPTPQEEEYIKNDIYVLKKSSNYYPMLGDTNEN